MPLRSPLPDPQAMPPFWRKRRVLLAAAAVLAMLRLRAEAGGGPGPGGTGAMAAADAPPREDRSGAAVYVLYPHGRHTASGGPSTLHLWHSAVLAAGFRGGMFGANPEAYGPEYSPLRPLPDWPPPDLAEGDVVLFPEYLAKEDGWLPRIAAMRGLGVRTVALVLGATTDPRELADRLRGWAAAVAVTDTLAAAMGMMRGTVARPMLPSAYRAAEECWAGTLDCPGRPGDCRRKRDLVILDNEEPLLPDAVVERIRALRSPPVEVIQLRPWGGRLTQQALRCALADAKAFVDHTFPGHERGPFEAAMMGAVPVVPDGPVAGQDFKVDTPVPDAYRAKFWKEDNVWIARSASDFADGGAVVDAVDRALRAVDTASWGAGNPVLRRANGVRAAWPAESAAWLSSIRLFVAIAVPAGGEAAAAASAAAWIAHHRLATVFLLLPSPSSFLASPAAAALNASLLLGPSVVPLPLRTGTEWPGARIPGGSTVLLAPPDAVPLSRGVVQKIEEALEGAAETELRWRWGRASARTARWDLAPCGPGAGAILAFRLGTAPVPAGAIVALPPPIAAREAGGGHGGGALFVRGSAACAARGEGKGTLAGWMPEGMGELRRLLA